MKLLSMVVPCYNEEQTILPFYQAFIKVAEEMEDRVEVELIFVDDGSRDGTLKCIRQLGEQDSRVAYLSFSRNFGKEAAIYAGLKKARGDYVGTMDVDLQDPPSLMPELLSGIVQEGYDCVATRRATRTGESPVRSFFARWFYRVFNKFSAVQLVEGARDYRLMTRQMTDAVLSLAETNRFAKGIFSWVGYETKWIAFENQERWAGSSKWSFWGLFRYSIEGILSFSHFPLILSLVFGLFFCVFALGVVCVLLINRSTAPYLYLFCGLFFLGGIQLLCSGVHGQYLAKIHGEVQRRPMYLTKEESKPWKK